MSEEAKLENGAQAGPRSVAEARRAVANQRVRISATIDQLEETLVEKKEALREKIDVIRPVRDFAIARPLLAVGIAAGAGLLLGLLSRGSRRDDEERIIISEGPPEPSRAGRLLRDMAHEIAGAGTALLVAQLVDRVRPPDD